MQSWARLGYLPPDSRCWGKTLCVRVLVAAGAGQTLQDEPQLWGGSKGGCISPMPLWLHPWAPPAPPAPPEGQEPAGDLWSCRKVAV